MQTKDLKSKIKFKEIVFSLNPRVYPQEAIYTTCYVFLDKFYLFLDEVNRKIKVSLKPKGERNLNLKACRGEFINELLNNTLRFMISKRNQKIREMIVKEALFFSQPKEAIDKLLLNEEKEKPKDWQKDPLGITMPWEEKYSKKKRNELCKI